MILIVEGGKAWSKWAMNFVIKDSWTEPTKSALKLHTCLFYMTFAILEQKCNIDLVLPEVTIKAFQQFMKF